MSYMICLVHSLTCRLLRQSHMSVHKGPCPKEIEKTGFERGSKLAEPTKNLCLFVIEKRREEKRSKGSIEMTDDGFPPPTRLMNFVSQEQLDEAKKTRGPRVEDGTAHRDRPLFEILKENKDKKDAEFNERFKHRPPKALDEDETEFLDKLELSRREYEQQLADDEAQQLRSFQEAVAAQSTILHELKETPVVPKLEEQPSHREKKTHRRSLGVVIKVKPQVKKARRNSEECEGTLTRHDAATNTERPSGLDVGPIHNVATGGLVSYSDESDDD
ncbi:hypothetical protein L6452_16038 [Arctium lappa]|uniref:Uncharacterized protein n=1 Tax=Arctium lappa TaxID=4217 RepID=A0ACB9CQI2_ARCLA|nr:hypothetical protein L6452_16038 [Arctium lappa]